MDTHLRNLERLAAQGDALAALQLQAAQQRVAPPAPPLPTTPLKVSASQIETFSGDKSVSCQRKWAFGSLFKLPQVRTSSSTTLGSVLHSVIERYYAADDLGRDPKTGLPIDLYPPGWHVNKNRWGKVEGDPLSPEEQNVVKKLVELGIQQSVLLRHPGRFVELEFTDTFEGKTAPKAAGVDIGGFIDLTVPGLWLVVDQKSHGSSRWCKSSDALANNIQMCLYGFILLKELRKHSIEPEFIILRHNNFITNLRDGEPPEVKVVEAKVSPKHLEEFWATLETTAASMRELKERGLSVDQWREIPRPESVSACRAYNGCPYVTLCSGAETPYVYKTRVERYNSEQEVKAREKAAQATQAQTQTQNLTPEPVSTTLVYSMEEKMQTPPAQLSPGEMLKARLLASGVMVNGQVAPVAPAVEVPPPAPVLPPGQPQGDIDASKIKAPLTPAATAPATPAATPAATEAPKKRRGRPPGTKNKPKVEGQVVPTPTPATPATPTPDAVDAVDALIDGEVASTEASTEATQFDPFNIQSQAAVLPPSAVEINKGNASSNQGGNMDPASAALALFGMGPAPAVPAPVVPTPVVPTPGPTTHSTFVPPTPAPAAPPVTAPPATKAPVISTPAPAPAATPAPTPTPAATTTSTNFTYFSGCTPLSGPGRRVLLSQLMQQIATALGGLTNQNYYAIKPFERRDMVGQAVDMVVADLIKTGDYIIEDDNTPDCAWLGGLLKSKANLVVAGLR